MSEPPANALQRRSLARSGTCTFATLDRHSPRSLLLPGVVLNWERPADERTHVHIAAPLRAERLPKTAPVKGRTIICAIQIGPGCPPPTQGVSTQCKCHYEVPEWLAAAFFELLVRGARCSSRAAGLTEIQLPNPSSPQPLARHRGFCRGSGAARSRK